MFSDLRLLRAPPAGGKRIRQPCSQGKWAEIAEFGFFALSPRLRASAVNGAYDGLRDPARSQLHGRPRFVTMNLSRIGFPPRPGRFRLAGALIC